MIIINLKNQQGNFREKSNSFVSFNNVMNSLCRKRNKTGFVLYNLFNSGFFIVLTREGVIKTEYRKVGMRLEDLVFDMNLFFIAAEGYIKVKL